MRRLTTSTILVNLVALLYFAIQVDSISHGSRKLLALPIWNFSRADCSLFRNETALRPMFEIWPEDISDVPFHYCCEYRPNGDVQSAFELSNYTYGPDSGILRASPYYDIGILEVNNFGYYLLHWAFWGISLKHSRTSMLHCDMTDLQRLYAYRLWSKALVRGTQTWAVTFGFCGASVILSALLCKYWLHGPKRGKANVDKIKARKVIEDMKELVTKLETSATQPQINGSQNSQGGGDTLETSEQGNVQPNCFKKDVKTVYKEVLAAFDPNRDDHKHDIDKEELFADACHILLLAFVGSCLLEGIVHSPLHSWRSQFMFNASVSYAYLTLFATASTILRHCKFLAFKHQPDWRWQKVFGQLAAQFMMGTYLGLVDDKSEHSLDPFAGPVLGTCVAASVWSAGVEMVVIVQFLWIKIFKRVYLEEINHHRFSKPMGEMYKALSDLWAILIRDKKMCSGKV